MSSNETIRDRAITKTSVVGIVTNIFLSAFKAVVGLLSNSIAIILDSVNNLSDALSSVITIVGVKIAHKKPDKEHPYGHGRVEYLSGTIIASIVFSAGVLSLVESIKKIFDPEVADYSFVTILIICVAIATKLILGRYVKKQGEKYRSDALIASGADASFDAVISASTLVGAFVTMLCEISIDGYIGAIISVFIIKTGVELITQPVSQMLGARANVELTKSIKAQISLIDGVFGVFDLILHDYGPDRVIGSVHIGVDDKLSAREIHLLTQRAQQQIYDSFGVYLTFGIYAVYNGDDEVGQMQKEMMNIVTPIDGVIQMHGLFIDVERKKISFDVVVDFDIDDQDTFLNQIKQRIEDRFNDYQVFVNLDVDYSD